MRNIFLAILIAFTVSAAYGASSSAALQSADGTAISSSNPLPVTFGTGDQLIGGNLTVNGSIYGSGGSAIGGWTLGTGKIYTTSQSVSVGIDTTTPAYTLDVAGDARFSGGTAIGIGTASPQTALEVIGTAKASNLSVNANPAVALIDLRNLGSQTVMNVSSSSTVVGDLMTISAQGSITSAGSLTITSATSLGWTPIAVSASNGNAVCTKACVLCQNSTFALKSCLDTITGTCFCAGEN